MWWCPSCWTWQIIPCIPWRWIVMQKLSIMRKAMWPPIRWILAFAPSSLAKTTTSSTVLNTAPRSVISELDARNGICSVRMEAAKSKGTPSIAEGAYIFTWDVEGVPLPNLNESGNSITRGCKFNSWSRLVWAWNHTSPQQVRWQPVSKIIKPAKPSGPWIETSWTSWCCWGGCWTIWTVNILP